MAPTQMLANHRSSSVVQHAPRCRRHLVVPCSASTGFGSTAKPKKDAASKDSAGSYLLPKKSKKVDIAKELSEGKSASKDATAPSTSAFVNEAGSNWLQMTTLSAFPEGKDRKVIELANKGMLLVYRHKGALYCSDLYSTAYRFPLLDGPITDGPTGPQITVPLDGTIYDLATGKVLSWCPSSAGNGNPLQGLFAGLKRSATPVDLTVYPVRQQGDAVFVNYNPGKQAPQQ